MLPSAPPCPSGADSSIFLIPWWVKSNYDNSGYGYVRPEYLWRCHARLLESAPLGHGGAEGSIAVS